MDRYSLDSSDKVMSRLLRVLLLACVVAAARAQDDDEGGAAEMGDGDSDGPKVPVAILEHRQEVTDDGSFNYAFTADNGLQQNEMFHPDGSRTGSYQYVDPRGETVLVKYRADRFGFHVLDGSSIPSTPPQHAETQQQKTAVLPTGDYVRAQELDGPGEAFSDLPAPRRLTASAPSSNSPVAMALQQGLYQRAVVPLSKQAAGPGAGPGSRARASASASASASHSMHFLQREARHAFYSDMDSDTEQSASHLRPSKARAPQSFMNDVAASRVVPAAYGEGGAGGEGEKHYDDGSYERHVGKYDDGSYEPHAARYDDGSYEKHAQLYDDGSYEKHAAMYDDGSYEPHAAKYDDGSYRFKHDDGHGAEGEFS